MTRAQRSPQACLRLPEKCKIKNRLFYRVTWDFPWDQTACEATPPLEAGYRPSTLLERKHSCKSKYLTGLVYEYTVRGCKCRLVAGITLNGNLILWTVPTNTKVF